MRKLCNNEKYLEILKHSPEKAHVYTWTEVEDKTLWSFKSNPVNYKAEVKCLLRYKSMAMIRERIEFLKVDLGEKAEMTLKELE